MSVTGYRLISAKERSPPRPGPPSRREVELWGPVAILDLDDPQIGVEPDLPFESRFGVAGIDPFRLVDAGEQSVDAGRQVARQRRGAGP